MKPWDEAKAILEGQDIEVKNIFMLNRLLSFVKDTFLLTIEVNRYQGKIPHWAIVSIFKHSIKPRRSAPYIKYAFNKSKKRDTILVQKLSSHLCCSESHARQTIELLKKIGKNPESYFGLREGE
jgi:hypothetical protein